MNALSPFAKLREAFHVLVKQRKAPQQNLDKRQREVIYTYFIQLENVQISSVYHWNLQACALFTIGSLELGLFWIEREKLELLNTTPKLA